MHLPLSPAIVIWMTGAEHSADTETVFGIPGQRKKKTRKKKQYVVGGQAQLQIITCLPDVESLHVCPLPPNILTYCILYISGQLKEDYSV